MINRFTLALFSLLFSAVFFCEFALAKEDTAQITLKKTAISKQNLYTYTVKKGDILSAIVRLIPNVSEEDIQENYKIIKDLNPDIADLNKLRPGQLLVLPGKPLTEAAQNKNETASTDSTNPAVPPASNTAGGKTYAIKKGDTLVKIIYHELKFKSDPVQMIRAIKALNPRIVNVNRIYAGQTIKLPGQTVFVKAADEEKNLTQEL